jgi:hypothetical protein
MTDDTRDPYRPMFGNPIAPWHRWFAWRPIDTVDRGTIWLRVVYRRRILKHSYVDGNGPDFWFQYAVADTGAKR